MRDDGLPSSPNSSALHCIQWYVKKKINVDQIKGYKLNGAHKLKGKSNHWCTVKKDFVEAERVTNSNGKKNWSMSCP